MPGDGDSFPVSVTLRGKSVGNWTLGREKYRAFQIGPIVEIIADGETQPNAAVKLAASPIAIFPPEYSLIFLLPEVVLPMQLPFTVTASFRADEAIGKIVVTDADGRHNVSVDQSPA